MPHEKQKIHYSGEATIGKDIPKTITETSEPKIFLPEPEITRNLNNMRPPLTKHCTIEIVVQSIKQCSLKYIGKNTSPQCAEKRKDGTTSHYVLCWKLLTQTCMVKACSKYTPLHPFNQEFLKFNPEAPLLFSVIAC